MTVEIPACRRTVRGVHPLEHVAGQGLRMVRAFSRAAANRPEDRTSGRRRPPRRCAPGRPGSEQVIGVRGIRDSGSSMASTPSCRVKPRVLDEQLVVLHQQSGGGLGALHVAPDPEHRLGDPAQHVATSCVGDPVDCCCCISCWRRRSECTVGWSTRARASIAARRWAAENVGSSDSTTSSGSSGGERLVLADVEHPRVLGAAAWLEFTTRLPSTSATRVRPPGSTQHLLPVVDGERAQVQVPRGQAPTLDERRTRRQRHDRLGDPATRVGLDVRRGGGQLGIAGL